MFLVKESFHVFCREANTLLDTSDWRSGWKDTPAVSIRVHSLLMVSLVYPAFGTDEYNQQKLQTA